MPKDTKQQEKAGLYSNRQIQEWMKNDKIDPTTKKKLKRLLAE